MPDESEPLMVDCGAHGKRVAAIVCGHMLGPLTRRLGFVENSSDPHDLQAWCSACEDAFVQEGTMTEAFLAFTQAAVVCVECYARLKAWHGQELGRKMTFPLANNAYEELVLRNIKDYGWHFTHVFGDDDGPSFSYSVGVLASYNHPEIILFGLPQEAAHGLVSLIASRAATGDPVDLSLPSDEIIQGYSCVFVNVSRANRQEYALSDCWLYQGSDFPMYQLVWASKEGLFPWHPDAPESFRWSQPVLADLGSGA